MQIQQLPYQDMGKVGKQFYKETLRQALWKRAHSSLGLRISLFCAHLNGTSSLVAVKSTWETRDAIRCNKPHTVCPGHPPRGKTAITKAASCVWSTVNPFSHLQAIPSGVPHC